MTVPVARPRDRQACLSEGIGTIAVGVAKAGADVINVAVTGGTAQL